MTLTNVKIGVAITGSFCTYDKIFKSIQDLVDKEAIVTTIFSPNSISTDTRFGKAKDFLEKADSRYNKNKK